MFPGTTLEELSSEEIYKFERAKPIYLSLLKYYSNLHDYPRAQERWRQATPEDRSGMFWWLMNEGWESFCKINPELPIHWLAQAHRALHWDHVPINFHPWALAMLEKFDLARYQATYQLPDEEYQAIARDLPVVLESLRNYPRDKLAPPIDETSWGFNDQ